MSQTWTTEIPAAETLSTSRTTINDNFDALRSCFIGPADPGGAISGQIWINTTDNKVYMRGISSNIEIGTYNAENLGHLSTAGGDMLGTIDMKGNRIIDLPDTPSGDNEAVSKFYADLMVRKDGVGATLTGDIISRFTTDAAPPSLRVLAHKGYVDTKLTAAGGSMTGLLALDRPSVDGGNEPETAGTHALGRNEISAFVHFNLGTGHRHDGVDSRKVLATNMDAFGSTASQVLVSNGPAVEPSWQSSPAKFAFGSYIGTAYYNDERSAETMEGAASQTIDSGTNPDITWPVRRVQITSGTAEFPFVNDSGPGGGRTFPDGGKNASWEALWNPDSGTGYASHTSYGVIRCDYLATSSTTQTGTKRVKTFDPTVTSAEVHLDGVTNGFKVTAQNVMASVVEDGTGWPGNGPNVGGAAGDYKPDDTHKPTYHYICWG